MAEIPANSAFTAEEIRNLNQSVPGRFVVPGRGDLGEVGYGEYLAWVTPTRGEKQGIAGLTEADPAMTTSAVSAGITAAIAAIPSTAPAYLTATPSGITAPSKLFWGDGDLTEQIDGDTLVLESGTSLFSAGLVRGSKCLNLDGATTYTYSGANVATYRNVGEMSAVCLAYILPHTSGQYLLSCGGAAGSASADNHLYSLLVEADTSELRYYGESGSGTAQVGDSGCSVSPGWHVVGFTRDSAGTGLTFYIDGYSVGTDTVGASDGGGSAVFRVGGLAGPVNPLNDGSIASLALLFGDSWSASEHLAIADILLGS